MRLYPKSRIGRIILWVVIALFTLLLIVAIAGGLWLKKLILTGGSGNEPLSVSELAGVVSGNAMVVGTTGAEAQVIGLEILKNGGSAADAAMATSMAQITLAAGSWVSFAGLMNMVYYDAATGEIHDMNACFDTAAAETDPMSTPGINWMAFARQGKAEGHYDGRTVLVPGFMAGVEAAHKRFGVLPWADIFEPSIRLAEEGFKLNEGISRQFAFRTTILSRFPETKAVFTKEDGSFYGEGDLFRQPALAKNLRAVAEQGAAYMYTGAWGEKFVDAVQGIGGRISMEDMASYEVTWKEPLHTTYRGYDLYVHGLPSYGGINLIEAMNLLEAADLASIGHYADSAESLYWMSHITRAGLSLSRPLTGTPEEIEDYYLRRTTKEHASALWREMQANGGFERALVPDIPHHSDAVVAIDPDGNMAALTHSINTVTYGETGLVIDGVSVPDALTNQREVAAVVPPGDRLPDPVSPVIILREGQPLGAFSTIGAGLHERLVNVLYSVLAFDMTPQEALNQPSLAFAMALPGFFGRLLGEHQTIGSGAIDPEVLEQVSEMGLDCVYNPMVSGYVVGITIDPETGELNGGTIERLDGRPVGF
jgi:gamma-glutamyltranspeptidase/glutathione hydrolase